MSDAPTRHWRVLGSTPPGRVVERASPSMPATPPAAEPIADQSPDTARCRTSDADAMPCDRCGAATYRMHAVWRCPKCGYKSDCCGW